MREVLKNYCSRGVGQVAGVVLVNGSSEFLGWVAGWGIWSDIVVKGGSWGAIPPRMLEG